MQPDERLRHALGFGPSATAYAQHRPDYAQAAVRWALELAPGVRVLDLGAGTGKQGGDKELQARLLRQPAVDLRVVHAEMVLQQLLPGSTRHRLDRPGGRTRCSWG